MSKQKIEKMLAWCKELGVRPLPLVSTNDKQKADGTWYGGKAPVGTDWGIKAHPPSAFIYRSPAKCAQEWLKAGDMRCVGFQLGPASGGLIDIDLDCPAAIERAAEYFGDLNPVEYGRGGVRTHMMLRATQIPDTIQTKYTGMIPSEEGENVGVELRTGYGKTKSGDPAQLQSMVLGYHPDSGERLEFMGGSPRRFEDFPSVPFTELLARFGSLCDAIGARKVWARQAPRQLDASRRQWADDGLVDRVRAALPPLSVLCAEYAGDGGTSGRLGLQQCPFCQNGGNPVLSVDDTAGQAYCFWDGCPSRSLGARGGFDAFHLVGEMERLSQFGDVLELLAKRCGIKLPGRRQLKSEHKKSAKQQKKEDTDKQARREMTAEYLASEHTYLHGVLYTTFDGRSWLAETEHQLAMKARGLHERLHDGEYLSPYALAEIKTLTMEMATPPADSVAICPLESQGKSIQLQTGEILTQRAAFQDAVLCVDDAGQIKRYDRTAEELYVDAIPHQLPTAASPTPVWDSFLYDWTAVAGADKQEQELLSLTIHTMIGACLIDNRLERLWLLYGMGGSGKGVLLRVLRAIVGAQNWYATTLQALQSKFEAANARGRKVLCLPEMQARPWRSEDDFNLAMDVLKRITGRDAVGIQVKHVQHTMDAVLDCNVVAAANTLTGFPRDDEEGSAWGRRLVVIPTPDPPAKPDPSLADRIISSELAGIIYDALETYAVALSAQSIPLCQMSIDLAAEATESRWGGFCQLYQTATDGFVSNLALREAISGWLDITSAEVKQGHIKQAKRALRDTLRAHPDVRSFQGKTMRGLGGITERRLPSF